MFDDSWPTPCCANVYDLGGVLDTAQHGSWTICSLVLDKPKLTLCVHGRQDFRERVHRETYDMAFKQTNKKRLPYEGPRTVFGAAKRHKSSPRRSPLLRQVVSRSQSAQENIFTSSSSPWRHRSMQCIRSNVFVVWKGNV